MKSLKLLHISNKDNSPCLENDLFRQRLAEFGELEIVPNGAAMTAAAIAALVRQHEVYLAGWGSAVLPAAIAENPGGLKYICGITGSMQDYIPVELVDRGIPLTNWGDAPANAVAEGAMLLLLGCVKSLHGRIQWQRHGEYRPVPNAFGGTLSGMKVGVYGCGVIGRRFIELLRPFGASIAVFDPHVNDPPPECRIVHSLPELFAASEAIVIHSALTPLTRNSVSAELLAMLPDGGIFVNTARGGIVDQPAPFRELQNRRLRAGLDVLEPDGLEIDHPARRWENLILTCHTISWGPSRDASTPRLLPHEEYCLENLRRFATGEPLRFRMDSERYRLST